MQWQTDWNRCENGGECSFFLLILILSTIKSSPLEPTDEIYFLGWKKFRLFAAWPMCFYRRFAAIGTHEYEGYTIVCIRRTHQLCQLMWVLLKGPSVYIVLWWVLIPLKQYCIWLMMAHSLFRPCPSIWLPLYTHTHQHTFRRNEIYFAAQMNDWMKCTANCVLTDGISRYLRTCANELIVHTQIK